MKSHRVIFISAFFGLIARNILSTKVLDMLREDKDLLIVILAPQEKKDLYKKYFEADNIVVEGVFLSDISKLLRLEKIFFSLFLNSSDTENWRIERLVERHSKGYYLRSFIHWCMAKLSNIKLYRFLLRFLDYRLMPKDKFKKYFEKYNPCMVFSADVFHIDDVNLMREARFRKIKVVGMVRSWDNITSHGLNRIIPDNLVVNTPKIKDEAIKYNDINLNKITIVGIPHYDRYFKEFRKPKDEVFKELNLDPNKKTIFFAPPSDIYVQGDSVSIKTLNKLVQIDDSQLIIRLYIVGGSGLSNIKPVPNKIAIDDPLSAKNFNQADLNFAGDNHLADLLFYSDVVIAFASTLAIDAIVFNKPVIFIGFDGDVSRPYWRSLRRYYDVDHQVSILKMGGIKLAKSLSELEKYTREYLENPILDEIGRNKIKEERCWKLDGKSGERLFNFLIKEINKCVQ